MKEFFLVLFPSQPFDPIIQFWELGSIAGFGFRTSILPLPEHVAVRVANCFVDEKRKKKKDEEKVEQWVKEWTRLDQGKQWQALEEEDGEGREGGDGSKPSIQWDELEDRDEDLSSQ
jgi:hypothetical protein